MHREIQIKQFPIVTTHWWPKTRNERFVWENEQYLYRFLPLVHNHVKVIWVRTRIRCVTCVCARSGVGVNAWRRACLKRGAQIKHRLQAEVVLNKYVCGFWCKRQQEMDFFTGWSVIMDYRLWKQRFLTNTQLLVSLRH